MAVRKIVHIDEEKCNGCGLCIPNCAEGALQIVDGKAKLVSDVYCDGLGACLGNCPLDAIKIIERESDEFDEDEVEKHLKNVKTEEVKNKMPNTHEHHGHGGGCPGSRMMEFNKKETVDRNTNVEVSSHLSQWPVQLALVPPNAPYFKNADLLVTADCVPFAYGDYHNKFLKGKAVVVGCPKLDNVEPYITKIEEMIKINDFESITVLKMEVPCCSGIASVVREARDMSGVDVPLKVITIGLQGDIIKKEYL